MRPIAPSIRNITLAAAAAATGAPASSLQSPQPKFVYKLGNSLYVPLTSRCNSLTLPQLRGDGFVLPTPVVAALCRVRDAESFDRNSGQEKGRDWDSEWYNHYSDGGENVPPKMKLPPPPFGTVASLPPRAIGDDSIVEREPGLDVLLQEIRNEFVNTDAQESKTTSERTIESIVIAGEGEPILRLGDTIELVRRIRSFVDELSTASAQPPPSIRLTTNGLVVPTASTNNDGSSLPQRFWDAGISRVSVGLMTWNAKQYENLVKPVLPHDCAPTTTGFDTMCSFVNDAVQVDGDLEVETTAVDRPDVDKAKTEFLAESLGVKRSVRWRPYFP